MWKEGITEYLAAIDEHLARVGPYIEAAEFFDYRPERTDYPSHREALQWLRSAEGSS
jgi:hypothetical protein